MSDLALAAPPPIPSRLETLDYLRGVAVLGILLLNVVGFAWPEIVYLSPRAPGGPASGSDDAVYLVLFVLADGKFRGLFSLLFGASLLLLVERADAVGQDGRALQCRRLGWLAFFGLAHFFLLWWGDILFLYAVCGFAALAVAHWPARLLAGSALTIYVAGAVAMAVMTLAPAAPWLGLPPLGGPSAASLHAQYAARSRQEVAIALGPWPDKVAHTLRNNLTNPLETVLVSGLEMLPLMLLGMALSKSGFFASEWPRSRLRRWATLGVAGGLALTSPIAWWLWSERFPLPLVLFAWLSPAALGRLAMTIGYAALLVLVARSLGQSALGQRLIAAGRMALSNYLGTSLLMAALFQGWGAGWFARYDRLQLLAFVVLGWAAMLAWSKPWLARFRHGPFEWLWRSLTYGRPAAMRRTKAVANAISSH